MIRSLGHVPDPRAVFTQHESGLLHFSFTHTPTYSLEKASIELQVFLERKFEVSRISIFQLQGSLDDILGTEPEGIEHLANQFELPVLRLDQPWPLQTVRVAKPWGAEIWYTGIEERGVCQAGGIPLPWLLQTLPAKVLASASQHDPLLLKILDPLPDPNLGDLYFELHEKKIEVYIVTHVDQTAWPDGIGKIRYGFDQERRAHFASDEAFKAAYLTAVETYQACRNEIDRLIDEQKLKAGIGTNEPVAPAQMENWLDLLPATLAEQEATLRSEMESFTYFRDIKVGDVIRVVPYFPHSLQHGVRVIEFQTASYERHILSFGQKVLTQTHWDTREALAQAITTMPPAEAFSLVDSPAGTRIEVIADFSAFTALRLTIEANQQFELPELADYRLVICAGGDVTLGDRILEPEDACFVPADTASGARTFITTSGCVCIIAIPKSA